MSAAQSSPWFSARPRLKLNFYNPSGDARLFNTVIGAGLGGVIGSNLAKTGHRQDGTAIGAAIGGLAGYSLSNNLGSRYGHNGGQFHRPFAPQYGTGIGGYGAPYAQPLRLAPPLRFTRPLQLIRPVQLPQYNQRLLGYVAFQPAARPIIRHQHYRPMPAAPQPRVSYTPPQHTVIVNQPTIQVFHQAPQPRIEPVRAEVISRPSPVISQAYAAPMVANCPANTSKQSDGTCLSKEVTQYIPQPVFTRPVLAPTIVTPPIVSQPVFTQPVFTEPLLTEPSPVSHLGPHSHYSLPDTISTPAPQAKLRGYCYGDGGKRYNELGQKIKLDYLGSDHRAHKGNIGPVCSN